MTYVLGGTSQDAMSSFFAALEEWRAGGIAADGALLDAMASLVILYDCQAALGPVPSEEMARFRRDSALKLSEEHIPSLYLQWTMLLAESANENYWYQLSLRRSVIQSLLDDYQGTPVPGLIDPEELAELDDELRMLGQRDEQGPVAEEYIPKGLPAHHWWWHYPDAFKSG